MESMTQNLSHLKDFARNIAEFEDKINTVLDKANARFDKVTKDVGRPTGDYTRGHWTGRNVGANRHHSLRVGSPFVRKWYA